MLGRPQQPQGVVAVALEGQDGVDHVLEHAGPGQPAVLGDVTDEHGGHAPPLALLHQAVGGVADLDHAAGHRSDVGVDHRLDRVDHQQVGTHGVEVGHHGGQRHLRHQPHVGRDQPQPLGPQPDLLLGLLGRHVEHPGAAGRPGGRRLQQQGRLADARLAAEQGDRARHQAPAEHPVELGDAGGHGGPAGRVDLGQRLRSVGVTDRGGAGGGHLLDQGVPLAARRAPAGPLGRRGVARPAPVDGPRPGHGPTLRIPTDRSTAPHAGDQHQRTGQHQPHAGGDGDAHEHHRLARVALAGDVDGGRRGAEGDGAGGRRRPRQRHGDGEGRRVGGGVRPRGSGRPAGRRGPAGTTRRRRRRGPSTRRRCRRPGSDRWRRSGSATARSPAGGRRRPRAGRAPGRPAGGSGTGGGPRSAGRPGASRSARRPSSPPPPGPWSAARRGGRAPGRPPPCPAPPPPRPSRCRRRRR